MRRKIIIAEAVYFSKRRKIKIILFYLIFGTV